MKILVTAIALTFALPAAAQTAAPAPPHGQDHPGHEQAGGTHHGQHGRHQGDEDCCADRDGDGRMDCCERMHSGQHQGHGAPSGPPQGHQEH